MKIPTKATFFYILLGLFTKAVSFASTLLFTRILTVSEYGRLTLYMSWLGIAEISTASLVSGSTLYKGLGDFRYARRDFLSSLLGFYFITTSVICILLFALSPILKLPREFLPFIFSQMILDGVASISLSEKKFLYSYRSVVAFGISEVSLSLIISFLLIRYARLGYLGRILGFIISSLVLTLPTLPRGIFGRLFDKERYKYILSYFLPLLPHAVSLALSHQADKVIIKSVMGDDSVAKYSVAYSIGALPTFLLTSISTSLTPWINRRLSLGDHKKIMCITDELLSLFSVGALYIVALAPIMLQILAPKEYFDAALAIVPIAVSIIPYFAASINTVHLVSLGKGKIITHAAIASAAIGITANLILVRILGYFGAGVGALISNATSFIVGNAYLSRHESETIINSGKVLYCFVITLILAFAIYFSYKAPFLIPLILIFPSLSLTRTAFRAKEMLFE